jgi:chromosome segregation ATPase
MAPPYKGSVPKYLIRVGRCPMDWLKSKTTILAICFLAIAGLEGYGLLSTRNTMEERLRSIEDSSSKTDEKLTVLTSDIDVAAKKIGVTTQELEDAQKLAKQLKEENARVRRALGGKADSKTVLAYQNETTSKINAVHQETTTKIDGINGDVQGVRTDLDATRNDLKSTRSDLNATRDEIANSRRDLGSLIARNSTELEQLRRKGERDYIEFDITKNEKLKRVGDVMVQLKKTDPKRKKYEVVINADDTAIQKKDRTMNEPVTFLVGHDKLRYELVVNYVDKDRIRGYVSSPKDKPAAGEPLRGHEALQ